MVYLTQVLLSAFCITSIAVFGSFIFKIKHNYSFLLSCCFIALFLNLGWKFIPINLLIYSIYLISLVCFIMSLFRRKEIDFNITDLLEYLFFFFLLAFLSHSRYFLDEDEFTYWGILLKYFHALSSGNFISEGLSINGTKVTLYHQPFLPLFHFFNSFMVGFKEDLSIFSNNIFILSGFFFIFYSERIHILKKFFIFFLIYLLINNLSFGMVSIYADVNIAILYASILFFIYNQNLKDLSYREPLIFFTLFLSLFLVHRSGAIYSMFVVIFYFFLKFEKKKIRENFLTLFIIFLLFFIYIVVIRFQLFAFDLETPKLYLLTLFDYAHISKFLKIFLFIDIYFSDFGVTYNGVLNQLGFNSTWIPVIDINVLFWLLLISSLFFITIPLHKKRIIFFFATQFVIYTFIIYLYKIKTDNVYHLVYGRYIGIFFLGFIIFYLSLLLRSTFFQNKYLITIFFIILVSITPKKTIGFIVPEYIYLKEKNNLNFFLNRKIIKESKLKYDLINNQLENSQVIVVTGSNNSSFSEHESLAESIIKLEFYPNKVLFTDYLYENCFEGFKIFYNSRNHKKNKKNSFILNFN